MPEIRFSGFADEWEQRKLGEVADIYDGTHQTPKYQDEGVMFLSVENIKTLISNKFISHEAFKSEFRIRPQRGDVLITRIGDVGTANVVETDENLAYYVSLALLKSEKLQSYFLQASIHAPFVQKQIWKRTLHIAFPKKINKNEIGQVPINIPTTDEQDRIGTFFKQLDDTIALHQRELELLKETKKGFLQKMFPKKGEKVPEIRFPGFTEDWEQRKLGDMLSERKIRSKISKEIPLLAFAAGQGVIDRSERKTNNRDFLTKDANTKTYLLTKYNDIVYNPSNLKYGAIDRNKYGLGLISPIYVTFETNQVPEFIELIVTSYSFKQRALQYEEGTVTKRQSVKPENLLTLNVSISKTLDEQQKIGTFFKQLDDTIALHQRELDLLKETKKGFLQKLFV